MTTEKPLWPQGKSCAFLLCFDLDGSTIWLNKVRATPGGLTFLRGPSVGQYGPNRGADRIMRILDDFGLKATFFVPGTVMHENPAVVRRMIDAGHEVAHHGLDHELSYGDTVEAQMAIINESQRIFTNVIGHPAEGFRCTGSLLPETQRLLYTDANTLYTMFNNGAERPSFVTVDGTETNVVHLPCRQVDDYIQMTFSVWPPIPTGLPRIAPYDDVLANFIDEAEGVRRYGGCVGTAFHPQVSGSPGKAKILERLIEHLVGCGDVWLPQCREAALWWRSRKEAK